MMVVITISNGDDVDADSERGGDRGDHSSAMAMLQTPTASVVMTVVITISNGDDVDADSECGDDGGDHYQQWR